MSNTIPTIDAITLAHVIGGAGQGPVGDVMKRAAGAAYDAGRWAGRAVAGALGGGQQPAPSNSGLSPIRPGMSGLAIRERLDNTGL